LLGGEPSESDQARLLGIQLQAELREPVAKICPEPLGVVPMLESHHEVVSETHDDHVAARVPNSPLVGPKVKDVVQVDVREQR
jgi:tRNA A37 threonylcarbamoyladenosine synthetase subunit TsaC/SUA5/YrdC